MDSRANLIHRLTDAMPGGFSFYQLGHVEAMADEPHEETYRALEDRVGIAFNLEGDIRGLLVLIVEQGLDLSTYTELGNILASRLATNLTGPGEVMISPPIHLNHSQLERLMRAQQPVLQRSYIHLNKNTAVTVQTLILLTPSEGVTYV